MSKSWTPSPGWGQQGVSQREQPEGRQSQGWPPNTEPPPGGMPQQQKQKRKVWPWILGGFAVFFLLAFAGCAIVLGGTAKVIDDAAKEMEAKQNAVVTGVVGKPVTNAGMTYTVTKVTKTPTLSDGTKTEAGAVFVVVDLTLRNEKNETKTFDNSNAKIVSGGLSFETSEKTVIAFGDDSLFLKEVQPGLATKGKAGFEVPTANLPGAALVIEDLWGDGKVSVSLDLR